MNRFLTLKPWTPKEFIACGLALALLMTVGPATGLLSLQGALAGAFGGLLLRHMALHGWSLLRGTLAQRVTLVCLWLVVIAAGGILAAAVGL